MSLSSEWTKIHTSQPKKCIQNILVKLLHFLFIAMKRWKFQNHCDESDECDEISKEGKVIIWVVFKHELICIIGLYLKILLLQTNWRYVISIAYLPKYHSSKIKSSIASSLSKNIFWGVKSIVFITYFSLRWIHCLLTSINGT